MLPGEAEGRRSDRARRPPRAVIVGEDGPSLRCAANLGEAQLADVVMSAETPAAAQRAAAALAEMGGTVRVSLLLKDAAPSDLVVVFSEEPGRVRDVALWAARTCPYTVLLIAARNGLGLCRDAARASGLSPNLILTPGGMPRARFEAARLAGKLDVARAQVRVPVLGGTSDDCRPVRRYATVAGIPAREISMAAWSAWLEEPEPALERVSLVPSVLALARAVLQDNAAVHSCGAWVSGDAGLPGGFVVMPVRVGSRGARGALPMRLTMEERAFLQRHAVAT